MVKKLMHKVLAGRSYTKKHNNKISNSAALIKDLTAKYKDIILISEELRQKTHKL